MLDFLHPFTPSSVSATNVGAVQKKKKKTGVLVQSVAVFPVMSSVASPPYVRYTEQKCGLKRIKKITFLLIKNTFPF